jgi:thymidylate kinase
VIAFVGVEAAGKSTMLEDVERWLGRHYTVRSVHAGKPPSTPLTAVPNLLLPALRRLLPEQRSTRVTARRVAAEPTQVTTGSFPLLFGLRSVLLAHDRRALLRRAFARSANGAIVLCDRYPSGPAGAPDGPQLGGADGPLATTRLKQWLRDIEERLYRDIPPPDAVLYLTAPFEVTLERNRMRAKVEPEEYLRSRHARSSSLEFGRVAVRRIDTNRPLEELTNDVRRAVWEEL